MKKIDLFFVICSFAGAIGCFRKYFFQHWDGRTNQDQEICKGSEKEKYFGLWSPYPI